MENCKILNTFASVFEKSIDQNLTLKLQLEIYDTEKNINDIWQIEIKNGKLELFNEEKFVPERTLGLSKKTLIKLYNNDLSPSTAFSENPGNNGNWDIDPKIQENPMNSLIGIKFKNINEKDAFIKSINSSEWMDLSQRIKKFSGFFCKEFPPKIIVNKENGINIHGNINGVALYSDGVGENYVFHVFFSLKKGEILEEPKFKFNIYVINGRGVVKIGDEEYKIEEKNYYLFNPKEKIDIKNNEEKTLEFLLIKINEK